jgi:hypothetical protein
MPISDYRDVLSYYSSFSSPRDTRADYAQGELDGRFNKPRSDERSLSGHELDIINQARADISRFRLQLQMDLHGSQASVTARKQQRYEEYESELRDLGHRHDSQVSSANKELGPISSLCKRQQEEAFDAEQRYGDLNRELGREPELHFARPVFSSRGPSIYAVLLTAMSFVELFINKGVFKDVLGGVLAGYAGAFIMGLAIVFFAHILGLFVRQWKVQRRPMERLRVWLGVPLILVLVVFSLYELSVIREGTLPVDEQIEVVGGIMGLTHKAALLFLLNVGVFLAGTLLSYFRHDPHPEYESLLKALRSIQAAEEKRRRSFDARLGLVEEEYRRRRSNLASRADRLQREIDEDLAHSESLPGREEAEMQKVVAVVTQRVLAYQSGNERTRDAARPLYFGQPTVRMVDAIIRGDFETTMNERGRASAYAE